MKLSIRFLNLCERARVIGLICALACLTASCTSLIDATHKGPVADNLGKRPLGTRWNDEMLESKATVNIRSAHPRLKEANFRVTSFNGVVLLTGQIASKEIQNLAERTVNDLRGVRKVYNKLQISGPTSMVSRSNDAWLVTKIKTAMFVNDETDANRIKVVTENGVVYLLGLLTRDEADKAVEVSRSVYGVQKIVKVFEYIN
jgi:osmotically-inducible protein OsmY